MEDRREFMKQKKAELGDNLARVLNLSSKRTTNGSVLKSDMPYLEFNDVQRGRHILKHAIQPAQMSYSIEDFLNRADQHEATWMKMMTKNKEEVDKIHAEMKPEKTETDINETLKELVGEMGSEEAEAIEDITQSRKIF